MITQIDIVPKEEEKKNASHETPISTCNCFALIKVMSNCYVKNYHQFYFIFIYFAFCASIYFSSSVRGFLFFYLQLPWFQCRLLVVVQLKWELSGCASRKWYWIGNGTKREIEKRRSGGNIDAAAVATIASAVTVIIFVSVSVAFSC